VLPGPRAGAVADPVRARPVQPHLLHPRLRPRRGTGQALCAQEEAVRGHPPVRARRRARVPGPLWFHLHLPRPALLLRLGLDSVRIEKGANPMC
jgi:hypothetical protein